MTNDLAILTTISTCFNNYNTKKFKSQITLLLSNV